MKFLGFIWTLFHKYPFHLLALNVLLIAGSVLEAGAILSLTPVIDLLTKASLGEASDITVRLFKKMEDFGFSGTVRNFLILFFALTAVKSGLTIFTQWLIERTRLRVMKDLICDTYGAFLHARWHFFVTNSHGTLSNTLFNEVNIIARGCYIIARLISSVFHIIIFLCILLYVSWKLSSIVLGLVALMIGPFLLMGRFAYHLGQKGTMLGNRNVKIVQETLGAAKIIIGYGLQQKSIRSFMNLVKEQQVVALKANLLKNTTSSVMEPISTGILILTFHIATNYQGIPLSEIFLIFYTLRLAIPMVTQVVVQKNEVQGFLPSWEQLSDLQSLAKREVQKSGEKPFTGLKEAIRLENVCFSYPNSEPVLYEINAVIPKGKMVAFVGQSGVGKSTLIDLLMALYEPSEGLITIDGKPLTEFDVISWRHRIGYVPQDVIIFDATIRENLLWSVEKATDEDLIRACQLAYADEFIRKLPQGYDTVVGDRGVRLSGGQRQRVALARAILRQPELLILDEATSALDSQSEILIQHAIEEIAKETTIVVVAHRLSTIARADCIYVLEKGRIVDYGTFDQLTSNQRRLYEAARLQGFV